MVTMTQGDNSVINKWKKDFEKQMHEEFRKTAFFSLCEKCNARVYEHNGFVETDDGMITFGFICPRCRSSGQKITKTGKRMLKDFESRKKQLLEPFKNMMKPGNIKKMIESMQESSDG